MAKRGDGIYLRGNTWWVDFRHQGTRHVARLGKGISRSVARELAQVKRGAILLGEAGIGRKRKDVLFEKAAEAFKAWAKTNTRLKTVRLYTECLKQLGESFNGQRLGEISPLAIEKHKEGRQEVTVMANRELACLKNLFNRAREWGLYEGENPVRSVKPFRESRGKLRFLEPEEEAALLAQARKPLRTICLVGLYAGLRVESEALTLRKADIDLQRGLLTVRVEHEKVPRGRVVPLNRVLREALAEAMAASPGEYLFAKPDGTPYRSIRRPFKTACRRAGLKDVTPHTLRHTFASRLVMAGVDLRTVQELGGWSGLDMVQRYAHLSPGHKQQAVERITPEHFTTDFTTPTQGGSGDRRISVVPKGQTGDAGSPR